MGIRYYAYAFDAGSTAEALAHPRRFLSGDPLADAWGFEPGASVGIATFVQAVPKRDMLYLDKAWSQLQAFTEPVDGGIARPAHRMFEGRVTHTDGGWVGWVRALTPLDVREVAADLEGIDEAEATAGLRRAAWPSASADDALRYATHYLDEARAFVSRLARCGRGMVYAIQ